MDSELILGDWRDGVIETASGWVCKNISIKYAGCLLYHNRVEGWVLPRPLSQSKHPPYGSVVGASLTNRHKAEKI